MVEDPNLTLLYGEEMQKNCEDIERDGNELDIFATRMFGYVGQKFNLTLPSEGLEVGEEPLTPEEIEGVMQRVCSIIEASDSNETFHPRVLGFI